jgi:carboxypeptidase Q
MPKPGAKPLRRFSSPSLWVGLFLIAPGACQSQEPGGLEDYREAADRLIQAAVSDSSAFERLAHYVDTFGPRFSGSESLERSLDWLLHEMEADGLENVRSEAVMVPRWVRGEESLELISPRREPLAVLGLGPSVATPPEGIRGEVLVVRSFQELEERGSEALGRIVLFNAPFTSYGETVQYRGRGAVAAARVGAVASLIRSVTPFSMNTPHTGGMAYEEGVPEIPHAAITLEDAEMLHRMARRGDRIEVHLTMESRDEGMVPSRNILAEVVGREYPDEVVVLGGHSDSWDVGQGAMDDGGGVVAAWEAVRLIQALGLKPRRTVRVVGWTAEEVGIFGGQAYAEDPARESERHILGIESDSGVFSPLGFGFTGSDEAFSIVQQIGSLLDPIGAGTVTRGGGGADIGPMMQRGMPGMGLSVEPTEYFWYHHTDADTLDKLDPAEFNRCVAAMAVMAYVVADLPEPLPR